MVLDNSSLFVITLKLCSFAFDAETNKPLLNQQHYEHEMAELDNIQNQILLIKLQDKNKDKIGIDCFPHSVAILVKAIYPARKCTVDKCEESDAPIFEVFEEWLEDGIDICRDWHEDKVLNPFIDYEVA